MRPSDIEKPLTAQRLREVVRYDRKTGKFYWLKGNNQKKAGDEAGWVENTGYVRLTIDGHRYVAHRLAWLYMTGYWPNQRIDHRNLIRLDNSWENIRPASDLENSFNRPVNRGHRVGLKGVEAHKSGKFKARIQVDGKSVYLGVFTTPELAHDAYREASIFHFGDFARAM